MQPRSALYRILNVVTLLALLSSSAPVSAALALPADAPTGAPLTTNHEAHVTEALQRAPGMFIENAGQFGEGARFRAYGGGRDLWLADDALWITVWEPAPAPDDRDPLLLDGEMALPESQQPRQGVALRFSFVGADPHPRIEPFDPLDTRVSYFIGNDHAQWRSDVPVWGGVRYVDLYSGMDLEVTGEGWQLVCDGANCQSALRSVRLRVEGADAVELTGGEGLRLTTAVGDFTLPLLTVEDAAPGMQTVTLNPQTGTFEVVSPFISPSLPHTAFQPQDGLDDLLYATFLWGSDNDAGRDIAVDEDGAAYVTGYTFSSDFPTTPGCPGRKAHPFEICLKSLHLWYNHSLSILT